MNVRPIYSHPKAMTGKSPPFAAEAEISMTYSHNNGSSCESVLPVERSHREEHEAGNVVLLAEDSNEMRALLAMHLRRAGFEVVECRDGLELVSALAEYIDEIPRELISRRFDLIISDIRMPGISGLSVADAASECVEFPPTILITAFGDDETHALAEQAGVIAIFDKPFEISDLVNKAREVLS